MRRVCNLSELMLAKSGGTELGESFATDGGDDRSRKADANMAAFDTTPKTDPKDRSELQFWGG